MMSMNDKTKDEIRKNTATGASAVIGSTVGTVGVTVINEMTANAHKIEEPVPLSEPAHEPKPALRPQSYPEKTPEPKPTEKPEEETENKQDGTNENGNAGGNETNNDLEVLAYDRMTNEDGSQMDVAVLKVDGLHMEVADVNLDGKADLIVCDANQNGIVDEGEVEVVQGQGISMEPFQQAAGFNPLFAQNDLPDYVNDADVDSYMA